MAFDGTKNDARLNREILIRELRENPPEWWNFHSSQTCAMAVGAQLGTNEQLGRLFSSLRGAILARAYGLYPQDVVQVFYLCEGGDKTPAEVADQLEAAPFVFV